jgi:hypothetical protein
VADELAAGELPAGELPADDVAAGEFVLGALELLLLLDEQADTPTMAKTHTTTADTFSPGRILLVPPLGFSAVSAVTDYVKRTLRVLSLP